jgi:arsenate reductase
VSPARRQGALSTYLPTEDPAAVQGTTEEIDQAFHRAFSLLNHRISLFLALPLDTATLQEELANIGRLERQ